MTPNIHQNYGIKVTLVSASKRLEYTTHVRTSRDTNNYSQNCSMDSSLLSKYQNLTAGLRSNRGEPRTPREELMVEILNMINADFKSRGYKEWTFGRLAGRIGKQDIFTLWGGCKDAKNPVSAFMAVTLKKK